MVLIRTLFTWLWLVFGTLVLGGAIAIVAPFDRKGRVWWRFARGWAIGLSTAMGMTQLRVEGRERLDAAVGTLLMMNHTSGIDIQAAMRASDRPIAFLAKRGLFLVPIFGWVMWAARMVSIDRRNRARAVASLDRAGDRLLAGDTLLIFPEGTRTRTGQLLPFKKGGFILAHQRGIPIMPMVVAGAREIHAVGFMVRGKGPVAIVVDEPIDPSEFEDVEALIAHTRSRFVRCAGRAARVLKEMKQSD